MPEDSNTLTSADSMDGEEEEDQIDEDSEEFHSKYQLCQQMSVTEKSSWRWAGQRVASAAAE